MNIQKNTSPTGTFKENKTTPIHKWYPYIEGYSYNFIEKEIELLNGDINSIYDPFGGSGTTGLVASKKDILSYYSETNPVMQFVATTKVNITRKAISDWDAVSEDLNILIDRIENILPINNEIPFINYDGFEKYYDNKVLKELLTIKKIIREVCIRETSNMIAKLALISILVFTSKMVRRSDLRFAKDHEITEDNFKVKEAYLNKLKDIMGDIKLYGTELKRDSIKLEDDARETIFDEKVSTIITSPPYLNGTNYIRNTKLELKMLDFVLTEKDLPKFHSKGIIAGINSVSKRNTTPSVLESTKSYVEALNKVAYDTRIPLMVSGYFYDMNIVIGRLTNSLKKDGVFILDIGDSQFAGIHIPTHSLLAELAENNGFTQYDEDILRKRKSYSGMELTQRVLRFKKN